MLTFASEYLVRFCNSHPHLSLETVSPALKLTQICCINIYEHFFSWKLAINHKLAPPLLHTYQASKSVLTNPTKYESKQNSKIPIFQLFNGLGEIWKYSLKNIQKSQYSITFINWKKLWSSVRATLTNPNSLFYCELGKNLRRPTFKNLNFEFKDELKNVCSNLSFTVEN